MSGSIPLIVSSEAVKRISVTPGPCRKPSIAVVYATRDGDLEVLDGGKPMRWADQMLTRYRMRYEVDISDHHLTMEFKEHTALPTQADVYHFHATVSAGFRVTDPAEVIRRNVTDAIPVVRGHLLSICRPITRQFSIEEAEEAESAIHARFRRDLLLQGGITLYAMEVRLSLDQAGREFLQEVQRAAREERVKAAQHTTNVNDVHRQRQLDLLKQSADHLIQEREQLMLGGQVSDPISMIRLHLQRYPHDTTNAMKMLVELEQARLERQSRETDRWQGFLTTMASNGMLQPSDIAPLRDAVIGHIERSAEAIHASATVPERESSPPAQEPAPVGWNDPLTPALPSEADPDDPPSDRSDHNAGDETDI